MILCKCGCGKEVCKERNLSGFIHGHRAEGWTGWARGYNKCVSCGTNEYKHQGNGLCSKCYSKTLYWIRKSNIGKWAKDYDCCVDCGRIDRPHQANGRCGTCHVNNLNRQKGVPERNIGGWSWYYDKCQKCGTTERPHVKEGLCRDCYEASKRDLSNGYEVCPVCNAKVVKLNQHISMRAKKCKEHERYQRDLFEMYFHSDLGLKDIAKELKTNRHIVTANFRKYFGKKETDERNQLVKSCLCSEKAALNYNPNNTRGTVVYYDSLNNGRVRFRSKLEKKFAKYLDRSGVKWVYEYKSFPYIDRKGKRRTYTPDFYFVDEDRYVEVKGFRRGDEEYKIKALRKAGLKIKLIGEGDFENAVI